MNQETNIDYALKNENATLTEYKDLKIVKYNQDIRGEIKPCLKIWRGKQKNPIANYWYRNNDDRNSSIETYKKRADQREQYKLERAAARKAFKPDLNIGDIYYASWGYDQTNVNFYQVVEIKGSATVVLRELSQNTVKDSYYSHGMACSVVPVKDEFLNDNTMTKRVGQYGIKIDSVRSASKYDGSPKYKSWYA
tara:strand:- start:1772 stop:2353 length:582 start_codon:yes stop_codon:yes gene_type:complete